MNSKNTKKIGSIGFFHHADNEKANAWVKKISRWLKIRYPKIKINSKKPDALIALGGDGSILEAARKYQNQNPLIVGLNLGHVGFLASVREPNKFIFGLKKFFNNEYSVSERIMLNASIARKNKIIFETNALNEVVIQNLLGVSEMEVRMENHSIQNIKGTGILIATATGSTAYNLSAHGPIIMPHMKCIVVSELLDHNIPTPSVVLDSNEKIEIKINHFRERKILELIKTKEPVDMVLISDGESIVPLKLNDSIHIKRSPKFIRFVELERNYFFKSLQEKFSFE